MLFSRTLPLADLIALCRTLRHQLSAGISLLQVFRQQAERGPWSVRPLAKRVAEGLAEGDSLTSVLEKEKRLLPPLLLALVGVGEETGHLAEIFAELEKYFLLQHQMKKQLRAQSLLPMIQLVLAFFIIAGLIMVLGMIATARNTQPITLFGLSGPGGALIFLAVSCGSLAFLFGLFQFLRLWSRQKALVDGLLLRLPALGPCLEAFVLGRFAMALHLTLDSGLAIQKALRLSLQATGNAAYAAQADAVAWALKNGQPLLEALTPTGLFPVEFLHLVAVGEEGGRVPEVMRHQADYYHEEAARRLTVLTRVAGLLVWLIYAIFMVVMIFRLASIYIGAIGG